MQHRLPPALAVWYRGPVIKEIRLQNARLYDQHDWSFPLNDLTVFCGTNSAGKSTILKSLLLLAQNIPSRGSSTNLPNGVSLAFSSASVDLGNFKSFVSHNEIGRELHLGISIENVMQGDNYKKLDPRFGSRDSEGQEMEREYREYTLDADYYFRARQSLVPLPESTGQELLDLKTEDEEEDQTSEQRAVLCSARFRISSNAKEILFDATLMRRQRGGSRLADYFLRMPKRLLESEIEGVPYDYAQDPDPDYGMLRLVMPGLIPERIFRSLRTGPTADDEAPRFLPLPGYLDEVFNDLRVALSRIAYLGPLRATARRYYPIHTDPNLRADVTGEQLPALLRERGGSSVLSASPITHTMTRCTLSDALDTWLHFLRTGIAERAKVHKREFRVNSMQDAFVELGIRSSSGTETHALADSGFGYSQLIPILVRGLMLQMGGTLIIEQPEVHLNPGLQVRLSDFFVAMAQVNKQILIETHSEHIVNAIRAIASEEPESGISRRCTIVYLDSLDGEPVLHKLDVLPDGTIPDWPQGFFGEGAQLLGRIMRARKEQKR